MKTVELNLAGQVCPSSLLLALREVNARHDELSSGALSLLIRTDNRDATGTIPDAVRNMGFSVAVDKEEGRYVIRIWHAEDEE
ncbi:MAG: sulfurtransferase TusA family protein [Desulfuromonadales bacterium]|nr:sulfurtransferase TusA family protein [Desulfuromonadales bacterium]